MYFVLCFGLKEQFHCWKEDGFIKKGCLCGGKVQLLLKLAPYDKNKIVKGHEAKAVVFPKAESNHYF